MSCCDEPMEARWPRGKCASCGEDYADTQAREEGIQARFLEFHEANPHVYQELVSLAREARAAGAPRVGIKQLFEIVRWNHSIRTRAWDFKLNNNFHSRYARLMMEREADLTECFETRELRAV